MANKGTRLLLWLTAFGLMIMVSVTVAVVLLMDAGGPRLAEDERTLHLRLSSMMRDAPGNEGLFTDPADMPPLTTEVAAALRAAAADESVTGLFFEVSGVGVGWAQAQEIRSGLLAFREAGKPCVAWGDTFTNREYYLASACSEVHLAPAGLTLVNGLAITQTYYKGTFDKIGVQPNFEHVGDFKSAVEPYERTEPSEAAAEATNTLLDSIYGQLVAGIAEGRELTYDEALALVENPPMTPEDALEAGMVDGLSFRDEVMEAYDPELETFSEYLRDQRREWRDGDGVVAVLHAEGAIISGGSGADLFGGQYIGDRTMRRWLKEVREDEDVIAVVLRVNSPGGSGSASDSIWREVERTMEEKPVVVSMGDYAASGGYYIAMGTDHIVAQPGTLTGSIGVFGGKLNLAGVYEKLGMSQTTFKRGRHAGLLSANSDFDDAEREKYRRFLSNFYETFVTKAAEGREMDYDTLHAVAQGRVWTGEQALEHGLVDSLGGLELAIEKAVELAEFEGEVEIQRFPERKGFIEQLFAELEDPELAKAMAEVPAAGPALAQLTRLERVLARDPVVAMLPYELMVH